MLSWNLDRYIIIIWRSFHILCPNVKKAHVKKKNLKTSLLRWLGREILQNVAWTRKLGGSNSPLPPPTIRVWKGKSRLPRLLVYFCARYSPGMPRFNSLWSTFTSQHFALKANDEKIVNIFRCQAFFFPKLIKRWLIFERMIGGLPRPFLWIKSPIGLLNLTYNSWFKYFNGIKAHCKSRGRGG